jgi:hypothetical protein
LVIDHRGAGACCARASGAVILARQRNPESLLFARRARI